MRLHSDHSLETQVGAMAPTSLDRTLISQDAPLGFHGFGADVRAALRKRAAFHIELGMAEWKGDRLLLRRNVIAVLSQREMESLAQGIAKQTGGTFRPLLDGQGVQGSIAARSTAPVDALPFWTMDWASVSFRGGL